MKGRREDDFYLNEIFFPDSLSLNFAPKTKEKPVIPKFSVYEPPFL